MCILQFGTVSDLTALHYRLKSSMQTALYFNIEAAVGMSSSEMRTPKGSFQHALPDLSNQHDKLNHFWAAYSLSESPSPELGTNSVVTACRNLADVWGGELKPVWTCWDAFSICSKPSRIFWPPRPDGSLSASLRLYRQLKWRATHVSQQSLNRWQLPGKTACSLSQTD